MGNLIVCADGTWNTPDDKDGGLPAPTNVVKLHAAAAESANQTRYYHPGVGTDGSAVDRLLGGGIGKGLDDNIKSGYKWLAVHYKPGDRIFLFGFSRGAYTVRSLGGMISRCGMLDLSDPNLDDKTIWDSVDKAFDCYRSSDHDPKPMAAFKFHNAPSAAQAPKKTPIYFIGVWDTVGALGIPDDLGVLDLVDDPKDREFHDTNLSAVVQIARHAVAMDEMRQSFAPTLWTVDPKTNPDTKQIWFAGVHGDVGGGYINTGLSDAALLWMLEEAETAGLELRSGVKDQIKPNFLDVLHDSRTGIFSKLKTEPRQVPVLKGSSKAFHQSALDRAQNPPLSQPRFWPTTQLKTKGDTTSLRIYASERWNVTGLFLDAGVKYRFDASGEWLDGNVPCGPDGPKPGFKIGKVAQIAAAAFGQGEGVFQRFTHNANADFIATKRIEAASWFALVGVVANGSKDLGKSNPPGNEPFIIGKACEAAPALGGYLYCFANDAWYAYANNKGSVTLTVTRLT